MYVMNFLYHQGAFAEFLLQHITSEDQISETGILTDLEGIFGSKEELRRLISQNTEIEEGGHNTRHISRQISTLSHGQISRQASTLSQVG